MKPYNDEFNPLTEEDLRRREEDEEFRRRVRNEVRRIQSGEAAEDIERDIEEEEQERQQAHEAEERERKKRSALRWMIFFLMIFNGPTRTLFLQKHPLYTNVISVWLRKRAG